MCSRSSGLTYNDVKAGFTNSYTDSVEQMKDDRMHMFTLGTGIPASSVMDLASARDIKLLDLADAAAGRCRRSIRPTSWSRSRRAPIPSRTRTCKTIGYYTHVVAACALPEDTVYKMTAGLMANKASMSALYKDMAH